jgi:hypothetical protein
VNLRVKKFKSKDISKDIEEVEPIDAVNR